MKNALFWVSTPGKSADRPGGVIVPLIVSSSEDRWGGCDMDEQILSRNEIIEEYQGYVEEVAGALIKSMNLSRDLRDEMISAGYVGLVEAAERYDDSASSCFRGYAYFRIRGAIIDFLRDNSELSGRSYQYARALRAIEDMEVSFEKPENEGEKGSDSELARMFEYVSKGAVALRISLSEMGDESAGLLDEDEPEELMLQKEKRTKFQTLISRLPEKEQVVVKEYYFEDRSFHEIADRYDGMSKSWISRLHSRAIDRLSKMLIEQGINSQGVQNEISA